MSQCFRARYMPPPPPSPGKIVVDPPHDEHGRAICAILHLTPDQARQLMETLKHALDDYESYPE
jgi:hypothetical protein